MMYDQYTGSSLVSMMHQQQHPHQHPQQHHHHHLQQQQQQQQHHDHHHRVPQQHQQQPQPTDPQQQHQHQQFMEDTERWLDDDASEEFMPKVVQRRAKRIIPDAEKDDKYWEKRKRNNMAAKRSRENKRLMENDIRHKVSYLEEQNALLRKEITLIKTRYGLPPEQSLLTAEERAQCMLEVKNAQEASDARRRKESAGSADDVSSTSPSVYPMGMHHVDDSDGDRRGSGDNSSNSPKMKDENVNSDSSYGPSAYGPFNPSPSWGPAGTAGIQSFAGNSPGQNFSPPSGAQSKLPPISNAFQEKNDTPYNRFVNGGVGGYTRPPYDYYMQYASQGGQMLYGGSGDGSLTGAAPADLSTNRNKRQEEQRSGSGGSGGGVRNLMASKNTGLPNNAAHSMPNTVDATLCLDDVAAMASSLGQVPRNQDQFSRGLTLPTHINTPSSTGHSLPAEAAHTASTGGIKGPDQEHLKRENDALKMAVRTLTAQVEQMKDQAYKD